MENITEHVAKDKMFHTYNVLSLLSWLYITTGKNYETMRSILIPEGSTTIYPFSTEFSLHFVSKVPFLILLMTPFITFF